jgi:hypothetical protein
MQKDPVIAYEDFTYYLARGEIEPPKEGFSTLLTP